MWLIELFKSFGSLFNMVGKAIPSDKIREDNNALRKPRKEGKEMIEIYNREYIRLVSHPEINIATDVNFVDDNLPDDQKAELIEDLTNRIFEHRKNHPIIFREFLQTATFLNWEQEQKNKLSKP